MNEQKRLSISEKVFQLLFEQVSLQPSVTADFIRSVVQNDVRPIEEPKEEVDNGEEKG